VTGVGLHKQSNDCQHFLLIVQYLDAVSVIFDLSVHELFDGGVGRHPLGANQGRSRVGGRHSHIRGQFLNIYFYTID
jgi:hypothetical protein